MAMFRTWTDFEIWLNQKGLFHIELGLERISRALEDCGLATHAFNSAQVLGTNGKGSTSAFLASLGHAHGLNTGLYISPHFLSPRERILINGKRLSEQAWIDALNGLADLTAINKLTYFELLTLLAVKIFAENGVEFAVFEAGLGGRNDATTAIPVNCQCFTPIALDHVQIIGPDIGAIAADKCGAIRPGAQIFSAPQYPVVEACLLAAAERAGSQLAFTTPAPYPSGLSGSYQANNAGLALAAWRFIAQRMQISPQQQAEAVAVKSASMPGRLQWLPKTDSHPEIILDCAHNPHAINQLCQSCQITPTAIIYSALADKDWQACVSLLLRLGERLIVPQIMNSRAAQAAEIAAYANRIKSGSAAITQNMASALALLDKGPILICGSFYLLADFFLIYPHYLERKFNG